jgi:hypothetical protein
MIFSTKVIECLQAQSNKSFLFGNIFLNVKFKSEIFLYCIQHLIFEIGLSKEDERQKGIVCFSQHHLFNFIEKERKNNIF